MLRLITLPGFINDTGFVFGLVVICWGLISRSFGATVTGFVFSALSRQTALLLIPPVAFWWIWVDPDFFKSSRVKNYFFPMTLMLPVAIYWSTGRVAQKFALPSENLSTIIGIFHWIQESFSASIFFEFIIRWGIPFALPGMFLLGLLIGISSFQRSIFDFLKLNRKFLGLLSFWPAIGSQPLLGGPAVTGQSSARLGALALVPFVLAVGIMLKETEAFKDPCEESMAVGAFIAIGSMHHIYSYNGIFSSEKAILFFILEVVVSMMLGILVLRVVRRVKV